MNKPTVIVTGGAGYIGSHTIIELLEKTNYHVVSIDNFSNSSKETYSNIKKITNKDIDAHTIDLCDREKTFDVFKQYPNVVGVIHFAAYKAVPESVADPYKYYHNNINSELNVLEACLKFNVKNFIFSSSCSVYGNIDSLPVNEQTKLNKAESPYAFTKQVGEEILKDYSKAFPHLQMIALRYFNPVGAHISGLNGENPINKPSSLVPIITQTASGRMKEMNVWGTDYKTRDGSCIRDYIHVSDIALAHINALEYLVDNKQYSSFSIFNLGTGNGVSVLEAIASFEKVSGQKLNYKIGSRRPGDVEAIYSDTSFTEKELGWKAKYSLDEMMASAWKWEQNIAKQSK
ncbi:MAG: UDP-glucose 4-epimerase GalE [Bacteroidetes bacterium]|nr:UDP-glucose 4-epimerase GalE [Bacteroidota bacterium]